jgi:hypothetical protein
MVAKTIESDSYGDGIFKLVPRWDKCISVAEDCVKK